LCTCNERQKSQVINIMYGIFNKSLILKHTFQVICALPLAFFCMVACKKSINKPLQGMNTGNNPNFYIAGESNRNPCLWINGKKNILSASNGNAYQVWISGNDIYVTGYLDLPNSNSNTNPGGFSPVQYVYWKNGVENKIGNILYENIPFEPTISIVNNNVYYDNGLPWENGSLLNFNLSNYGLVQMVTSYGTDVYFVGTNSSGKMAYWKNGVENNVIPNETTANAAYSIAVSSNNVFVGGADSNSLATVWTNGIPENLHTSIPGSYAVSVSSLLANGTDIYAVAELMAPTSMSNGSYLDFYNIPVYWKNGIENDLPLNGDLYGNVNTIFVNGADVYACGQTTSGAVYWKNGVEMVLGSDYGSVSSILIR
jgi:hypothetical protein